MDLVGARSGPMSKGTGSDSPGSDWTGVAADHPFGLHTLPYGVFTDAAREPCENE